MTRETDELIKKQIEAQKNLVKLETKLRLIINPILKRNKETELFNAGFVLDGCRAAISSSLVKISNKKLKSSAIIKVPKLSLSLFIVRKPLVIKFATKLNLKK